MSFPSSPQGQPALAGGSRGGRGSSRGGSPRMPYSGGRGGKGASYHHGHGVQKSYPVHKTVPPAGIPSTKQEPPSNSFDKNEKIPGNLPKAGNVNQSDKLLPEKNQIPKSSPSNPIPKHEVIPNQPDSKLETPIAKPIEHPSPQNKVETLQPAAAAAAAAVKLMESSSSSVSAPVPQSRPYPGPHTIAQNSSPQSSLIAEKTLTSAGNAVVPISPVQAPSPLLPIPAQPPSPAPPIPAVVLPNSVGSPSLSSTSAPIYKQNPFASQIPAVLLPGSPLSNASTPPQKLIPLDLPISDQPKPIPPTTFSPSKPFDTMSPVFSRQGPPPPYGGSPYMTSFSPYPYTMYSPMAQPYPPQIYANMYPGGLPQYPPNYQMQSLPQSPQPTAQVAPKPTPPAPTSKKLVIFNPKTKAVVTGTASGGEISSPSSGPVPDVQPVVNDLDSSLSSVSQPAPATSQESISTKNSVDPSTDIDLKSEAEAPVNPISELASDKSDLSKNLDAVQGEVQNALEDNLPVGEVAPLSSEEISLKDDEKLDVDLSSPEKDYESVESSEQNVVSEVSTGISIRDEDPNDFLRSENEDDLNLEEDAVDDLMDENFIALDYPEGVWGPHNPTGLKKYPRDFLLQFKDHCVEPPEGLNASFVLDESKSPSLYPVRQNYHFPRNSPSRPPQPNMRLVNTFGPAGFDRNMIRANQQRYPMNPRAAGVVRVPRLEPLKKSENAWQRPKRVDDDKKTLILMKVNGILNKITRETFVALSDQILNVGIDSSQDIMDGIISLLFEKALLEPGYSSMYADLCLKLSSVKLFDDSGKEVSFRVLLLNKCQTKFETKQSFERTEAEMKLTDEEWEERVFLKRKNILGNIKFIGELFKKGVLAERIIHFCIVTLLQTSITSRNLDSMECLCGLMMNIGNSLDHEKGKARMDEYFKEMKLLAHDKTVDSRLRFRLDDVIDLRARGWKKIKKDDIGRKEGDRTKPARVTVLSRNAEKERPPVQIAKAPPRSNSSGLLPTPSTPPRLSPIRPPGIPDRSHERRTTPDLESSSNTSTPERRPTPVDLSSRNDSAKFEKLVDNIIEEYLSIVDDVEVCECVKDLNEMSSHYYIVTRSLLLYFEKKDKDRLSIVKLFGVLFKAKLLEKSHFVAGFRGVLDTLADIAIDIPFAPKDFGSLYAVSVNNSWIDTFIHVRGWCNELESRLVDAIYGEAFSKILELESADALMVKLKDSGINSLRELFPKKTDDEFKKYLNQYGLEGISQY